MTLASEAAADADRRGERTRGGPRTHRKFPVSNSTVGRASRRRTRRAARETMARLRIEEQRHPRGTPRHVFHPFPCGGAPVATRSRRDTYAGRSVAGCSWAPRRLLGVEDLLGERQRGSRCSADRCPRCSARFATAPQWDAWCGPSRTGTSSARCTICWVRCLAGVPRGWPTPAAPAVENILAAAETPRPAPPGGPDLPGEPPGPGAPPEQPRLLNLLTADSGGGEPADPPNGIAKPRAAAAPRAGQGVRPRGGSWPSGGSGTSRASFGPRASRVRPIVPARRGPPGFEARRPRVRFRQRPAPGRSRPTASGSGASVLSRCSSLFGGGGGASGAAPGVGGGVDACSGRCVSAAGSARPASVPWRRSRRGNTRRARARSASVGFPRDRARSRTPRGRPRTAAASATRARGDDLARGGRRQPRGGRRGKRGGVAAAAAAARARREIRGGGGGGKADAPSAGPKTSNLAPRPGVNEATRRG